ncbi:response regulator transcription factor [Larkinella punicea]|uniref:DNA-binding response regulator n=1 Tax=Larkinella punicea TaxID=2315727 RepID=A0A368JM48_9BACT|nr:response regulator transcription factor [Larkinella punicea]RCR67221.1 DNA-binding response regulator [Larkinella punicea]
MIRVAIFDDNKTFTDNLSLLFEGSDDYLLTGVFSNALNVVAKVVKAKPDVIIMDIKMPEVSGIEAVKTIKKEHPAIQILMQTVFEDEDKVFAAICAGASGYILKGTPPDDMLEAIAEVYTGGSPMSPSIARKVLSFFQTVHQPEPEFYDLSKREKEILKCLVNGLSYKLIADTCFISINTVNSHIRKIYDKLHVNSSQEAISKALRQKLVD